MEDGKDEPMSNESDSPRRDIDEVSIASDFSIIPEGCVGPEEISPSEQRNMASGVEFLKSEDIRPSSIAESSFGKVLFQNIQATYTADSDIAVSYVLTPSVTAKSSDRVALYRVGFGSPQDYLCYEWAPTPSKDHTTNQLPITVVFKANSLPKDAGEFFQFCYVTHEGQIVGVSTPFQLHPVGSLGVNNVCGVDDGEDGMVVVCSNESVLHDKINMLSKEKDKLLGEFSSTREILEQKEKLLEDKTQQLTMCQHHLQALETKMKKESSEKCELMGRVGQVVEEKGHLEDRVKTLDRSLAAATAKSEELEQKLQTITTERNKIQDELLQIRKQKEQLDLALQEVKQEFASYSQTTKGELEKLREDRDSMAKELEFWTSSAASDKTEKNSLALKCSTIKEELILKSEEIEKAKKTNEELEAKLTEVVLELTQLKDNLKATEEKLEAAEEEKNIQKERQVVISQDNEQLKVTISQLKERIENAEQLESAEDSEQCRRREAAERIASDLSSRLQTAKAEYQSLAFTNLRLVKKIKKLRQSLNPDNDVTMSAMTESVSSQGSSWLQVRDGEDCSDDMKDLEVSDRPTDQDVASMLQSCSSALTSCTSCSQSTQQLSETMHRKMEDIVVRLTSQIESLKSQLEARQPETMACNRDTTSGLEQQLESQQPKEELQQKEEEAAQEEEAEQVEEPLETQSVLQEEESIEQQEQFQSSQRSSIERQSGCSVEQQVLYSNSFLPAQRTAPVFLPEPEMQIACLPPQDPLGGNLRPSAPSPTPSMYSLRAQAQAVVSSPPRTSLVVPQPALAPHDPTGSNLPPPLLPETTPTARQAAVMSQFSSQQLTSGLGHESDDDDFHSTSDNDEGTSLAASHENGKLIECPMCTLSFQSGAIRLLEEHINSHLEHVCPVCSVAFQRNNQKKFEEHVHAHFEEGDSIDESNPLDDPSGPWGPQFRATRLLEID
ncbi:tax1-binding protein 1 homolog isoform X2 [Penaeus japonicus]|uniref:tax1-binding protein 1 homolog isoform X2 n=1 Tax=Penaeus japonicus TaxID=27405 RepID=UPI001C71544D|nr:tax1-binding protein 1 homolog isoform X2 [Penaeus japonicus]